MDRPHIARIAKIAFSTASAVVCFGVIALCVRSYSTCDLVTDLRNIFLHSHGGRLQLIQLDRLPHETFVLSDLWLGNSPYDTQMADSLQILDSKGVFGFGHFSFGPAETISWAPHWAFVLLFAVLAAAPWIPSMRSVQPSHAVARHHTRCNCTWAHCSGALAYGNNGSSSHSSTCSCCRLDNVRDCVRRAALAVGAELLVPRLS